MATTYSFSSLQDDVRQYLERGFSSADPIVFAQIPRLINLAERRIARELKIQGFQNVVVVQLQAGAATLRKPDRWRDTISFNLGIGTTYDIRKALYARSYEYCRAIYPNDRDLAEPNFYADYDYNNWLIAPVPNQAYPLEILYYELPVLLDEDTQTNWLTEYAPGLLLYGTLLEASPFLKNDERIATWQGFFDRSLASINGEDLKKVLDRGASRQEA